MNARVRRLLIAATVLLWVGCDAAPQKADSPASHEENSATVAKPDPEPKPDDKKADKPADRPNDETTAGLKKDCVAACIKRSQMRAVGPDQIEADCRKSCRTP